MKDPYLFDFLGTGQAAGERALEAARVLHLSRFLLELGAGFAFVGQQVPLEVGGDDFFQRPASPGVKALNPATPQPAPH